MMLPCAALVLLALAAAPLVVATDDPNSLVIPWFYGAPYSASYVGEGETVTWVWKDAGSYSIEGDANSAWVFRGRGAGASAVSQANFTFKTTFNKAGTYDYHCHLHPYVMTGQVIVKPKYNFGGAKIPWFLGISYGGASAIIREGDTVTWLWGDDLPHAIASMDNDTSLFTGPGSNNNTVSGEGTFKYKKKFTKAGVYLYKCQNHGAQMRGNITVLPKDDTGSKDGGVTAKDQETKKDKTAKTPPSATPSSPPPAGKAAAKKASPKKAAPKKVPKKAPVKKATRKLL